MDVSVKRSRLEDLRPGSRPERLKLRLKLRLNLRLFDSLAKWVALETGV